MEAYFGFVHLEQVFEELAEGNNALWAARDGLQVAEVLAVHGTEDEVALFL